MPFCFVCTRLLHVIIEKLKSKAFAAFETNKDSCKENGIGSLR